VRGAVGALRLGRRIFEQHELLIMSFVAAPGDPAAAMERVHAVVAEGADIVEVCAGADDVDEREEITRIVPFIAAVRDAYPELVIGVDTGRRDVAHEACAAGADLLTDCRDAGLAEVAVRYGAGLVGSLAVADRAVAAGVDRARIIVDLLHGGSEATWLSPEATRRLEELVAMGWPVLVSAPGEDVMGEAENAAAGERLAGDLAATAVCAWVGARVFRVHRVRETRRVLSMVSAIRGDIPPASAVRGLA
jgi:dihydropteroate synthase